MIKVFSTLGDQMYLLLSFLFLLQVKHLYIDFYSQTMPQVKGKGIYGNWVGLTHSLEHALGTFLIVLLLDLLFVVNPIMFFVLPVIDLVTHYHIDWMKMNWGNRDMMNEKFWHHLGLDQFAHQVVYLFITAVLFSN